MAGLGGRQPGAGCSAGIVYQPYYLLTFLLAAIVVWGRARRRGTGRAP
jgi:hypothetical protein